MTREKREQCHSKADFFSSKHVACSGLGSALPIRTLGASTSV
jgi:hypothetical protein